MIQPNSFCQKKTWSSPRLLSVATFLGLTLDRSVLQDTLGKGGGRTGHQDTLRWPHWSSLRHWAENHVPNLWILIKSCCKYDRHLNAPGQVAFSVVLHGRLVHRACSSNDLRFEGVLRHRPRQHGRPQSHNLHVASWVIITSITLTWDLRVSNFKTYPDSLTYPYYHIETFSTNHQSRNELRTACTKAFRRPNPPSSSV